MKTRSDDIRNHGGEKTKLKPPVISSLLCLALGFSIFLVLFPLSLRKEGKQQMGEEGGRSRVVGEQFASKQVQFALGWSHSKPNLVYCATVQMKVGTKLEHQTSLVEFELKNLSSNC
ncbi:hypothetical protein TIFTF001_021159 [Ficus carica]|uniref:Uncharacterized protein n=1 Tax=Ficus carica TaxID=3494 RepID=A0AA88DJR3_FICCA|nr:hypothetical protein TIFTF001_021159 [Ficus carica]